MLKIFRARYILSLELGETLGLCNICGEEAQALRRVLTVRSNDPSISVSHKE
jgi:hypothetical protein